MGETSRADFKQMVRAVRAGATWDQVRPSGEEDEHLRDSVLVAAGASPSPAVVAPPEEAPEKVVAKAHVAHKAKAKPKRKKG